MLGLRRKHDLDGDHRRALETDMRERLALGEDDSVKLYEVACGAPDCLDVVTAMLIIRKDLKTEIYRVAAPLIETSVDDLAAAMQPLDRAQDEQVSKAAPLRR